MNIFLFCLQTNILGFHSQLPRSQQHIEVCKLQREKRDWEEIKSKQNKNVFVFELIRSKFIFLFFVFLPFSIVFIIILNIRLPYPFAS